MPKAGGSSRLGGSEFIDELREIGSLLKTITNTDGKVKMDTTEVDKASEKVDNLDKKLKKKRKMEVDTSNLTETQKIIQEYGKQGRQKYLVSEEAMLRNLTQAYEQYGKAISDVQKRQSKNDVMRWAGAYRGAGYDTTKVSKEVFDLADQVYDSFNVKQASGKITNQMHYYSPESMKKLFDAMRSEAEAGGKEFDFSSNETHWAKNRRDTNIGKQVKEKIKSDVQQGVADASKEKIDIPLDDILNVDITKAGITIQKKIDTLRNQLEKSANTFYDKKGELRSKGKSEDQIDSFIRKYSDYYQYMDRIGAKVEQRIQNVYDNISAFSERSDDEINPLKDQQMIQSKILVGQLWSKAEKKASAQLAVGIKPSAKAAESGEAAGEKIADGMKKATAAAQETKEKVEQVGEAGESAGEKASSGMKKAAESAKETRQEMEQAGEAARSAAEAEKPAASSSAEKSAKGHREAAAAAEEHAEKAKEAAQAEEQVGKKKGEVQAQSKPAEKEYTQLELLTEKLRQEEAELDRLQKKADETKAAFDRMADAQEQIHNLRDVQAIVHGGEKSDGTVIQKNEFGFEGNTTALSSLVRQKISEGKMSKAAAYYGEYVKAGGTGQFFDVSGTKDITKELKDRYDAMVSAISQDSTALLEELKSATDAVREQRSKVDMVKEAVKAERAQVREQKKFETEMAAESKAEWSQGLNENAIAGVEAYIKKAKALRKEAYNETEALAQAMDLVGKIEKRDIPGLMDQFTKDTHENNALLGKMTGMQVRSQKQRNEAIRSLDQAQYDELIKNRVKSVKSAADQGIQEGAQDAAGQQSSIISKQHEEEARTARDAAQAEEQLADARSKANETLPINGENSRQLESAGQAGVSAMEQIGSAATDAQAQVQDTYEAIEKIMHLSWNGGESYMNLDLSQLIPANRDNLKRIMDTIKLNYDPSTWDTNFKHLNDFIYDKQRQLTRWFSAAEEGSGWDPKNNAFDAEVYKNFSGEKISDLKKMQAQLGTNAKTLFGELYSGGKIPDELKGFKAELLDQLKTGAIDAMSAVDQLLQKVRELYSEQSGTPSSQSNAQSFASDIRSLEGYSTANEEFVNQLIASVVTGQKEYDAAMEELRSHIAQRQEEVRAEQEKNLRVNTEIGKFASGSKPILDAMGIAENGPYPTQYSDFIAEIQSESIKGEEAVLKFAEAFGFVYDQVNQTWARPTSRKDDFLNATIEGYKEYIDTVAGGAEINSVQIAWDKMLDQKTFNNVLDAVNKINEAFRQGKLDSEGYIEGLGRLDGMDWAKYYARYLTKDDRFGHGAMYLDEAPEGWKKLEGALTAPQGYEWYSNGASRFSNEYQAALVKVREETQTTKDTIVRSQEEIQAEIERTNNVIKIQEQWMKYLGDPNAPVTSTGKRDATDQLRNATKRLANYRMHPEEFIGQMDEEKITVHWWKAMQEAQRQGVADSVIARYDTDISESDYNEALAKLQESFSLHKGLLQEAKDELVQLQAELQQAASKGPSMEQEQDYNNKLREQIQTLLEFDKTLDHVMGEERNQTSGKAFFDYLIQNGTEAQKVLFNVNDGFEAFQATLRGLSVKGAVDYSTTLGLDTLDLKLKEMRAFVGDTSTSPLSSSAADQHREQQQSAEDAAASEEHLKEAEEAAAQAGVSSGEATQQHQEQAQSAEAAASAEEHLKDATQDSAGATTGSGAAADAHRQQEEAANAATDAEEKLKGATAESQQTGSYESGATHAHREQQKAAEDAADAEKNLLQLYNEAEAGLNGARLISEKDINNSVRQNTYEISKGLTATGTYIKNDEGNWALQAVSSVANYNTLLQDTLKYTRALETAQASLQLAYEKQSSKEVIDSIQAQIKYYQDMIDKNNELADSYSRISGVKNAETGGLPYTKEQYDSDVAQRTKEIQLQVGKQSAEQIERQQAKNAAELQKNQAEIDKANHYITAQLEKLRDLSSKYDTSINAQASRGITDKTNLSDFQQRVNELEKFLNAMRTDKLDPAKVDQVTSMFGELKRFGEQSYLGETAKKGDLSRQDVGTMKNILGSNIDTFLLKIQQSKGDVGDLVDKVKELQNSISSMATGNQVSKGFTQLREFKAQLQKINEATKVADADSKADITQENEVVKERVRINEEYAQSIDDSIKKISEARAVYNDISAQYQVGDANIDQVDHAREQLENAINTAEELIAKAHTYTDVNGAQYFSANRIQGWRDEADAATDMTEKERQRFIKNDQEEIKNVQKAVDELAQSFLKLADAQERAEHSKTSFGRESGAAEVAKILKRQQELSDFFYKHKISEEQYEQILQGQLIGKFKTDEYEEKRNATVDTRGLGFGAGDNIEKTWDVLIQKAQQYQQILYKSQSGATLTVNEKATLESLAPLYKEAEAQALKMGDAFDKYKDKYNEMHNQMSLRSDAIAAQTIENLDKQIGGLEAPGKTMPDLYNEKVAELRANLEQLKQIDIENPEWFTTLNRINDGLQDLKTNRDTMAIDPNRTETLNRQMAVWLSKNTNAGVYADQVRELQNQLHEAASAGDQDRIAQGFENIRAQAAEAGKTGLSFTDGLIRRFKSLGQYLLSFASFYRIIGVLKQAVSIVKELDTGLMEVRKVAQESTSTLKEWQKTTFNQADIVGGNASQIEKSTAAWLRLGKSFEESQEAAQASVKLLNVSEFENIDDATTSLVSMRQAFDDLTYEDFIDKLNGVGDNFSSSTDQLAYGMQNVSAVLKVQGNDIDQSLALLTAANSLAEFYGNIIQRTYLIALIA